MDKKINLYKTVIKTNLQAIHLHIALYNIPKNAYRGFTMFDGLQLSQNCCFRVAIIQYPNFNILQ